MDNRYNKKNESGRLKKGKSSLEWMRLSQNGNLKTVTITDKKQLTPLEIAKHNKINDCWIIINGMVYDVTKYLEYHPGGVDQIMLVAGKDGTRLFNHYHSFVNYKNMLKNCLLGSVTLNTTDKSKLYKQTNKKHESINFMWKKSTNEYILKISINKKTTPIMYEDLIVLIYDTHQIIICVKIDQTIYQAYQFYCNELLSKVVVTLLDINVFQLNFMTAITGNIIDLLNNQNLTLTYISALENSPNFMADKHFIKSTVVDCNLVAKNTYFLKIKLDNTISYVAPICTHTYLRILGQQHYNAFTFVPSNIIDDNENNIIPSNYIVPEYDPIKDCRYVYFLIKSYQNNMISSDGIAKIKPGEQIEITTPIYTDYFNMEQLSNKKLIYLCSSGIGITPLLRIITFLINNYPQIQIKMLSSYKTIDEIVWKEQFEKLEELKPNLFKIQFTLTQESLETKWNGLRGRIDQIKLQNFYNENENDHFLVYICGSNQFIDYIIDTSEYILKCKDKMIGLKG